MDNIDEDPPRGGVLWGRLLVGMMVSAIGGGLLLHCLLDRFHQENASGLEVIFQAMLGYLILAGGVVICDSARP